jgi:hypothetical protein
MFTDWVGLVALLLWRFRTDWVLGLRFKNWIEETFAVYWPLSKALERVSFRTMSFRSLFKFLTISNPFKLVALTVNSLDIVLESHKLDFFFFHC